MKTIIEELSDLYQAEDSCNTRAKELRDDQLKLCRKALIGKCYGERNPRIESVEGEEYNEYTCFTEILIESKWEKKFSLRAVVIRFDTIKEAQNFGVCIEELSDCISEWIDRLEDAEEITSEKFAEAENRAERLIYRKVQKAIGEE